jgi:hypothetical protein
VSARDLLLGVERVAGDVERRHPEAARLETTRPRDPRVVVAKQEPDVAVRRGGEPANADLDVRRFRSDSGEQLERVVERSVQQTFEDHPEPHGGIERTTMRTGCLDCGTHE